MKGETLIIYAFVNTIFLIITTEAISNKAQPPNINDIQHGKDKKTGSGARDAATAESQDRKNYYRPEYLDHRGAVALPTSGHSPTGYGGYHINAGYGGGYAGGYGGGVYTSGNGYSYGSPGEQPTPGGHHQEPHEQHAPQPPAPHYDGAYPGLAHHGHVESHYGEAPHYGGAGYGGGYGGGHGLSPNKKQLLKGLLLPIAGVAILGAAAALASAHPVLLQLGVVSGRRRRSASTQDAYPPNPYVRPSRK